MIDKVFFDTHVLIYATAGDDLKTRRAQDALSRGGSISVQVLNEFANTARRKLKRSWPEIAVALRDLRELCSECLAISEHTHNMARNVCEQYELSFYDSLIVASALEATCSTLLTEDMQDGQIISGRLTIRNPFL